MFNCIRSTLSTHLKFHSFSPYSHKFYSVLSCNKNQYNLNGQKDDIKKVTQSQQQQFRFIFQDSIEKQYVPFYDKLASTELSSSIRNSLIEFHDHLCLPWWSCIVLTTLMVKFSFTLLAGLYQQYLGARIKLSKVELGDVVQKIRLETWEKAKIHKWSPAKQRQHFNIEMSKAWSQIVVKNNCHPFKIIILSYIQLPVWLLLSLNLKKLTEDAPPKVLSQLLNEGPFWSTNLLVPDPLFVCPAIIGISSLTLNEMNNLQMEGDNKKLSYKFQKNIPRLVSIIGFLVSFVVPTAVSFYWAMSIFYSFCQYVIFLSPRVRRFCRIPKTPFDKDQPYRHLYLNFKKKFQG